MGDTASMETAAKKQLSLTDLLALGIGQVIGAGIVTLVGQAIGITGQSAWVAYLLAIAWGFTMVLPYALLSSALRVKGGEYTVVQILMSKRWSGVYICAFMLSCIMLSLFGLSLGSYFNSLFPWMNQRVVAVILIAAFYLTNVLGVTVMVKAQRIMTFTLIVSLTLFAIYGATKINTGVLNVTSAGFLANGSKGLLDAVTLLLFSTYAHYTLMNYSGDAINPKKDIPTAMFITTGVIIVIYTLVTIVAAGVLPVEEVAGKPLTLVAFAVLSKPVALAFIVGGPIMAVTSTLNGAYQVFSRPLLQAAQDGWFPAFIAKTNKRRAPVVILTIIFIVGILPLVFNFDIKTVTRNFQLVAYINSLILLFSIYNLPKRFPEQWEKSHLHMPNWAFYSIITVCAVFLVASIAVSLSKLNTVTAAISLVAYALIALYSQYRYKSGKVKIIKSYEFE